MIIYLLTALSPILLAVVLMTALRVSPGKAMPLAWLGSAGLALAVWRMPPADIVNGSLLGAGKALEIVMIIFGAVLLLNVMRQSGRMRVINQVLSSRSPDRRIQVLVIGWMSSAFMEGAAGFGAAPALAAPLLYALGFPPLTSVVVALICNTVPVPFGGAGIPVLTSQAVLAETLPKAGFSAADFFQSMLNDLTAISCVYGMLVPLASVIALLLLSHDRHFWRSLWEITPLALFSALAFLAPWRLGARLLGPELPSMFGGAVGMALLLGMLKLKVLTPRRVWDFPDRKPTADLAVASPPFGAAFAALLPYLVLALLLLATRAPQLGLASLLRRAVLVVPLGQTAWKWSFLTNPGLFPLLPTAAYFAWRWRVADFKNTVLFATLKQISLPALAIIFSAAAVQIMVMSDHNASDLPGMLTLLARAMAKLRGFYVFGAVTLGALGTFFAGSCTVSDLLFVPMQFDTAVMLNLPPDVIVALQNAGGGLGSMIRIGGVVAACATVGLKRQEGRIILFNTGYVLFFAGLAAAAALILLG